MKSIRERTLGIERLLPVSRFNFDEIFRSPSSDGEWPAVAARIDDIIHIEDGKTGGVNPGDRRALYYLTRWLKPINVLEIGTHVGASTLHIAAALQRQELAQFTTVDINDVNGDKGWWKRSGLPMSPKDAIAALDASVNFIKADSVEFLDSTSETYDLIFLDGNHSAERVRAEVPRALMHLNEDGLIILHDYFPNGNALWEEEEPISGPYDAVQQLQGDGLEIDVRPFGELPWATKRGTRLTSLAALLAA